MPRTTVLELRNVESAMSEDRPVVCPAGEKIAETAEGPTCFCRVENAMVTVARDLSSWSVFCTGDHLMCPTWRAAREAEWAGDAVGKLIAPDGLRRNYSMADIEEIEERRAAGDFEGARSIQERITESRRAQGLRDVSRS